MLLHPVRVNRSAQLDEETSSSLLRSTVPTEERVGSGLLVLRFASSAAVVAKVARRDSSRRSDDPSPTCA
jgi:hypothetical protein